MFSGGRERVLGTIGLINDETTYPYNVLSKYFA